MCSQSTPTCYQTLARLRKNSSGGAGEGGTFINSQVFVLPSNQTALNLSHHHCFVFSHRWILNLVFFAALIFHEVLVLAKF